MAKRENTETTGHGKYGLPGNIQRTTAVHRTGDIRMRQSAGTLVKGVNVRRDKTEDEVWRVAPLPGKLRGDGWVPFQQVELPGTDTAALFMLEGRELGVAIIRVSDSGDPVTGNVTDIGQTGGEPLHIETVTAGTLKLFLRHGRTRYITYTGSQEGFSFTMHGEMPALPMPMLTVAGETNMSQPFGDITLSGTLQNGQLTDSDAKTAGSVLLHAYRGLWLKSASMGYALQPVIARCRLLDAAGDTIAVTAPVLLGATGLFQCCGQTELKSHDSGATFAGGALTARVYRAQLLIPKGKTAPWRDIVETLVVETTPQIDPVNDEGATSSIVSSSGSATTLRLRLPGISGASEINSATFRRHIGQALADRKFCTQLRIERPYAANGETTHAVSLRDNVAAALPAFHPLRDDVSYGACLHTSGSGTTLFADPMTEPFAGYSPATLITATETEAGASWKASAVVRILTPDGTAAVAAAGASGTGCTVRGFSPLLTYPDRNAREITLTIANASASGTVTILTETYPMSPVGSEDAAAVCISTDSAAVMPRGTAERIAPLPAITVSRRMRRGEIAVCRPGLGTMPVATLRCGEGRIAAMAESPRSRATWDFARRRLLIFGEDGIRVITLDADSRLRSQALLDNRPVTSWQSVCAATGDSGLRLLAIAGDDLVSVSQSAVATLMTHCGGKQPGWCPRHEEIWLAGGDSPVRRITLRKGIAEATEMQFTGIGETARLLTWGGRLLISTSAGLLDTSADSDPGILTPFSLCLRHPLRQAEQPLRHLVVSLFASSFSGEVKIAGDNGSRTAEKLVAFDVEGALNAPLPVVLAAPARWWIESTAAGTASADCEWRQLKIGS